MKISDEAKAFEEKSKREQMKVDLKKIFRDCYPELVDGNGNIKYPIKDSILRKTPLLHDIDVIPERPKLHRVFMKNSHAFEDLLQIWEFACNCLELPRTFKLEELYAGLQYSEDEEEVTYVSDIV
jgi:hypothetical protein